MTDSGPQNIVEAYKIASQAAQLVPEAAEAAYGKVVDFCEQDAACLLDDTLKRNTLLFWAYSNVAEESLAAGKYEQAIENWYKAALLRKDTAVRIELGQKMLEATNVAAFSLAEKAKQIVKISLFLQEAYQAAGDTDASEKMARLNDTAGYLLNASKRKH